MAKKFKLTPAERRKLGKAALIAAPFLILAAFSLGSSQLAKEKKAQATATQIAFQENTSEWLTHPTNMSEFVTAVESSQVKAVGVGSNRLLYTMANGEKKSARVVCSSLLNCEGLQDLGALSNKHKFELTAVDIDASTPTQRILAIFPKLFGALYGLMLMLLVYVFLKQSGVNIFSNDKLKLEPAPEDRFTDVIGAEEAKAALLRVKAFFEAPAAYRALGARPPRGVLMEGGPGVGKTMLARAFAGECRVPFIAVDGSYFTAMYYGMGVEKVKALFKFVREHAPCVLFIDELDGIGARITGSGLRGAEQETNRIINRMLVELDGFGENHQVVVIGATNNSANIDEALRRPGRFDMVINVAMPTVYERRQLFDLYLKKVSASNDIDTESMARMGAGLSPASIANLVNKAASAAAEAGAEAITADHLYRALETHQLGGEVSSVKSLLTPETRNRLALHEAGHAVVGHLTFGSVERISIEPRGSALGVTFITRETEEPLFVEQELQGRVSMTLGGREAELMVLGNLSSGASDDLEKATQMAITMVGNLGFSSTFGLLSVKGIPKELMGPDLQRELLDEARALLETAQAFAVAALKHNALVLRELADTLLEHETLSGEPLRAILAKLGQPATINFD